MTTTSLACEADNDLGASRPADRTQPLRVVRPESTGMTSYVHVNSDTLVESVFDFRGGRPEYRVHLADPSRMGVSLCLIVSEADLLRIFRSTHDAREQSTTGAGA